MTQDTLPLAEGFPAVSNEEWLALVEKVLKGAPFEKKMVTKTHEGFSIQPLYTRADWPAEGNPSGFPGAMPFSRGADAIARNTGGWIIRQDVAHPDPARAAAQSVADLEGGSTALTLILDQAGRAGLDADDPAAVDLAGMGGVMVSSLEDMDSALSGVFLDGASIGLRAGAAFEPAAALLAALWDKRVVAAGAAQGAFNADPIGVLAAGGSLPMGIGHALSRLAALAAHTAATYPKVTAVMVDGAPWHDAGASESQMLACQMSTAVAYLKAMEAAGMDLGTAARQIVFDLPMDADIFLGIAKLRAARLVWARVCEACGIAEGDRAMRQHAGTARRILTRRDPWVNMLRTTVTCFSAAAGGADSIGVAPFDAALGVPGDFGRRIARNVQIILWEESHLARVIDPAGGSWYVETLTDRLAREVWGRFQELEGEGGILASLESGAIQARIAETWEARRKAIGTRKDPITGVSEFPNITEAPVEQEAIDLTALRSAAAGRLSAGRASSVPVVADFGTAVDAAKKGVSLGQLAKALSDGGCATVAALPSHALAEDFEALRDAADAADTRPTIFLATLGPIAQHTARATYAKNFFEAGGIAATTGVVLDTAEACADAFKASGAKVAVLCSSDTVYETLAEAAAQALKAAGAGKVWLAGAPGDKKDAYAAAGVDGYIHMGCDVLGTLVDLHAHLGLKTEG